MSRSYRHNRDDDGGRRERNRRSNRRRRRPSSREREIRQLAKALGISEDEAERMLRERGN